MWHSAPRPLSSDDADGRGCNDANSLIRPVCAMADHLIVCWLIAIDGVGLVGTRRPLATTGRRWRSAGSDQVQTRSTPSIAMSRFDPLRSATVVCWSTSLAMAWSWPDTGNRRTGKEAAAGCDAGAVNGAYFFRVNIRTNETGPPRPRRAPGSVAAGPHCRPVAVVK